MWTRQTPTPTSSGHAYQISQRRGISDAFYGSAGATRLDTLLHPSAPLPAWTRPGKVAVSLRRLPPSQRANPDGRRSDKPSHGLVVVRHEAQGCYREIAGLPLPKVATVAVPVVLYLPGIYVTNHDAEVAMTELISRLLNGRTTSQKPGCVTSPLPRSCTGRLGRGTVSREQWMLTRGPSPRWGDVMGPELGKSWFNESRCVPVSAGFRCTACNSLFQAIARGFRATHGAERDGKQGGMATSLAAQLPQRSAHVLRCMLSIFDPSRRPIWFPPLSTLSSSHPQAVLFSCAHFLILGKPSSFLLLTGYLLREDKSSP